MILSKNLMRLSGTWKRLASTTEKSVSRLFHFDSILFQCLTVHNVQKITQWHMCTAHVPMSNSRICNCGYHAHTKRSWPEIWGFARTVSFKMLSFQRY